MEKGEISDVLGEIAILLELKGDNPFKIRAYQSGQRALDTLEEELGTLIGESRLGEVKGIGKALTEKIETLFNDEPLPFYDDLLASVEPGLIEMLEIPGLGAKKIRKLHDELGVDTIGSLTRVCESGEVAKLAGFGAKSVEKILSGIQNREAYSKRHLWWIANETAQPILEGLRDLPQVARAEAAGSLRRKMETVGDLDFIAASDEPEAIMDWFVSLPDVREVSGHGKTKSSVRFESGMQADLRVVPPDQFVFALHHFTGSKDHNVAMRSRALSKGFSLSEWGLRTEDKEAMAVDTIEDEEQLFKLLDLNYIPPELREGLGEIESAEAGQLPELVQDKDLKGVFHNHTHASDGDHSIEEMTQAAQDRGWDYLGLADHSKASFQTNGLDEARVEEQIEKMHAVNASGQFKCHVFTGIECDILKDGSLDLDDSTLEKLDYVVVSVHSSFTLSEEEMTQRFIKAIEHPCSTMVGHLTGRLLLKREPYLVNIEKVVDAAIANRVIIEMNAHPQRLDMDWRHWKRAASKGLLTSVNPDAHSVFGLQYASAGINACRKGWLTADSVFNTWPIEKIKSYLAGR
ncbi:MAG: DNA polymerase/3'-5' exonuclease PolX [Verrucomicrobia bacterium]|nr:DNA polymerase/3'-5' exonuclease PolX [Verrucomicrobiota bacterium]